MLSMNGRPLIFLTENVARLPVSAPLGKVCLFFLKLTSVESKLGNVFENNAGCRAACQ